MIESDFGGAHGVSKVFFKKISVGRDRECDLLACGAEMRTWARVVLFAQDGLTDWVKLDGMFARSLYLGSMRHASFTAFE
jgi:hypothetical protein